MATLIGRIIAQADDAALYATKPFSDDVVGMFTLLEGRGIIDS